MPETLYLIDGHAQIFRAYYAIRGGLRSPVTSEPTHAVYGFAQMLLKLLSQYQPHYVAVAVDMPGKTFRDELYADYKANRGPAPDDLHSQIPRIFEMIDAFGIPVIGQAGIEADDIIATIARRILDDPACAEVDVKIVSKDKDLEQLLCDRVVLCDVQADTTLDAAGLLAAKGITPAQVVDLLTLTGDTSDNVPGVPGIGPKTAAQLIQQFGSIEGIYANIDQIKGKRRENLEGAREGIPLSRTLVTLKSDADIPFTLDAARVRPLRAERVNTLFRELGFHRFQEEVLRLAGAGESGGEGERESGGAGDAEARGPEQLTLFGDEPAGPATAADASYRAVTTREQLADLVATLRAQPLVSVDTETTGLERDALLCGLSFSWEPGQGVYVPVRSPSPGAHLDEETVLGALGPVLSDASVPKCGHNVKFDAAVLRRAGVPLRGVVMDTMLASTLIDASQPSHKLDALALSWLGYRMIPITDLIGDGAGQVTMDAVPLEKVVPYAAEDADIALRLAQEMAPRLESLGMLSLMRDVEAPLAPVIAEMEENGVLCDPEELARQGEALGARVAELRRRVMEICGYEFLLDSTKQLAEALFDRLGLTPGKRTKTGRSTDIEVLEKLASEADRNDPRTLVPGLVIEYRQLNKLISTYLGNLRDAIDPKTKRIHTTFHQLVTATGRLASQNPNLQNIPVRTDVGRLVRKAFPAPPDHRLICADYSQIELRLLAHLSQDEALLDAFARDLDIHAAVAAQVFGTAPDAVTREQRSHAKTINFGIIYGVTPYGLARRIEGMSVPDARRLIADYKERFPGIDRFLAECVHQALQHGYVATLLGRRRPIPEVHALDANTRSFGERLAINSVVQGSAADLIKLAMVNVQRRIERDKLPMKLLLQIHDELVLEAPADAAEEYAAVVRDEMERALSLSVPLKAEAGIGADWMSAK